ncbi:hypothetical protein QUB68_25295 [Microcoleus sp. A006_D1]|uniref:hypothetical protein n=1 Tax=Microcoleus sp. A006_D1 TaxID=3055267 RepID=UPI002FCEA8C9
MLILSIAKEDLRAMISLRATLPSELRSHDYTKIGLIVRNASPKIFMMACIPDCKHLY